MNLRIDFTLSTATNWSKGDTRKFGSMFGNTNGSLEFRVTLPPFERKG